MDTKRIVLKRIAGGDNISLKPTREELIAELYKHYGLPIHEVKLAISECLQEGFIEHLYNRYSITQNGLDFLNNMHKNERTTPINQQLNPSYNIRFVKWLKVTLWTVLLGVIGSLIASAVWEGL